MPSDSLASKGQGVSEVEFGQGIYVPGNTPFIRLEDIFCKLECVNPTGSIKDRIAEYILMRSEKLGLLTSRMRIVEATSGNTGIALAYFGRRHGYPVTIVMPENMTESRKALIRSLGAELILCSKEGSFGEAVRIRDEIARNPKVFCPDQFSNPLNTECHRMTTGREIVLSLRTRPKAFVAGVGTGGTLMGVGLALKEAYPKLKLIAVEPSESAVMSGRLPGPHGIYGIGDGFIPSIVQDSRGRLHPAIDEVWTVSTAEATQAALELSEQHGFCVGISSGANFVAALRAKALYGKTVTILPDGFPKYQAEGLHKAVSPACPFRNLCSPGVMMPGC